MQGLVVPSDTRYVPLTQQKWCCVPTCFQIIMLRHGIPLVPAELIGHHMGLVVPEEGMKYFWNGRTGERPPSGYGTQAGKKEYAPNTVFKKLKIPLKVRWSLINVFKTIDQFKKYLEVIEENDRDVLICYDWGKLFNRPKHQGGHVCVLDRVYIKKNQIRMIDPDFEAAKWQMIDIDDLYEAMIFHGKDKSAGFWEIQYITE